jgi:hypothetical protein
MFSAHLGKNYSFEDNKKYFSYALKIRPDANLITRTAFLFFTPRGSAQEVRPEKLGTSVLKFSVNAPHWFQCGPGFIILTQY